MHTVPYGFKIFKTVLFPKGALYFFRATGTGIAP